MKRLLAISGSLRTQSTNTKLLQAVMLVSPANVEIVFYDELAQIPPFNPDLETTLNSGAVMRLRQLIQESAAVIISTPEYAHGLPGALKNALDWLVGSGEFSEKPVVLMNASARAVYAQASLREVLTTMNARVLHEAEVTIELQRRDMTAAEIVSDAVVASKLDACLKKILDLIDSP